MKAKFMDTMSIRLPKATIEHLRKLKEQKELSSMSVALKYWIEQEYNARIESRLTNVEETMNQILTGVLVLTKRVNNFQPAVCATFQDLVGKDHKWAREIRKATNCKGCPVEVKSQK